MRANLLHSWTGCVGCCSANPSSSGPSPWLCFPQTMHRYPVEVACFRARHGELRKSVASMEDLRECPHPCPHSPSVLQCSFRACQVGSGRPMVTSCMAYLSTPLILWLQPDPLRTMASANEGDLGVDCTRRTKLLLMTSVAPRIAGAR